MPLMTPRRASRRTSRSCSSPVAFDPHRADADWLLAWVTGRSLARGLPLPFADRGGWRAEIGSDTETRRWVYAGLTPELRALAEQIREPGLNLRALATPEAMRWFLPVGWHVQASSYAMVAPAETAPSSPLPNGYRLELQSGPTQHMLLCWLEMANLPHQAISGSAIRQLSRTVSSLTQRTAGRAWGALSCLPLPRHAPTQHCHSCSSRPKWGGRFMRRLAGACWRLTRARRSSGTALSKTDAAPLPVQVGVRI